MVKYLLLIIISISTIFSTTVSVGVQYLEWPQGRERFPILLSIKADSTLNTNRDPIQVLYLIDVSKASSGDVRNRFIKGGVSLINSLQDKDEFGIVLYSEFSRTLFPITVMSKDNRLKAIAILERLGNAEDGRNLTGTLERLESEFSSAATKKISGRYLLYTQTGAVKSGEEGRYLEDEFLKFSKNMNCRIFSICYGDEFNEDIAIDIAEKSGGRSYFVDEDNLNWYEDVYSRLSSVIPFPQDTGIELTVVPEKGLTLYEFGSNIPITESIKVPVIAQNETRNIWLEIEGAPIKSKNLDVDFEYFSLMTRSDVSNSTMLRVPVSVANSAYNNSGAPELINYSILYNLDKSSGELVKGDKEFRKQFAAGFKNKVLDEVEVVKNQIGSPEMDVVYNLQMIYYNYIKGGSLSSARIAKKIKYARHSLLFSGTMTDVSK